jgi:hypothetical protein
MAFGSRDSSSPTVGGPVLNQKAGIAIVDLLYGCCAFKILLRVICISMSPEIVTCSRLDKGSVKRVRGGSML